MERPSLRDATILASLAREVLNAMPPGRVSGDDEDVLEAILAVLQDHAPGFDEYQMTRALETEHMWDCDRDVMEAFGVASGAAHQAVRDATRAWVRSNGIKPRLALADQVTINAWAPGKGKEALAGEIVGINPEEATYTVMIPALGHVREGLGTHGLIVAFEDLHTIVPPAAEFELSPE